MPAEAGIQGVKASNTAMDSGVLREDLRNVTLEPLELDGVDITGGHTVGFAYTCFNQLSVDRQSNSVSDVRCRPTIDAKMPRGTVLVRQQNVVFHVYLPTETKLRQCRNLPTNA